MPTRIPPPVLFLCAGAAQVALTRGRRITRPSAVAAGVLTAGCVGLHAWSVVAFHRHGTTIDPRHPGRAGQLLTTGPFAVSRNPIYLAMTGLLAAHAVLRRSPVALAPAAAFVAAIDGWQIPAEEQALARLFGEDYRRYQDAVGRWL